MVSNFLFNIEEGNSLFPFPDILHSNAKKPSYFLRKRSDLVIHAKKRRRRGRKFWHLTALLCHPRTFYIGMQISLFSALAASSKPKAYKSEGWGSNPALGLKMSSIETAALACRAVYWLLCTPKARAPPRLSNKCAESVFVGGGGGDIPLDTRQRAANKKVLKAKRE